MGVEYSAYSQSLGWQDWVSNGGIAGKPNEDKDIEAIKIRLTSINAENFDIHYQVNVKNYGWLDWAKNGEIAGSIGSKQPIVSMNIILKHKGSSAPGPTTQPYLAPSIFYSTHVQSHGWLPYVKDGDKGGTTGQAKRLEGIILKLENAPIGGGLEYRTHVQSFGWMDWVTEDQMSGTEGLSKRLEAIQIKLTG